jgi:ABC-2 type transport system permease protein
MKHSTLTSCLALFRFALKESLAYRWDLIFTSLLRFLPMLGTYLLWRAVYDTPEGAAPDPARRYSFAQIVSYLFLVQGVLIVCGMSGLAHGMARDVRTGHVNQTLMKPVGWIQGLFARRVAEKLSELAVAALPFALVGMLVASEMELPRHPVTGFAFLLSLAMSFLFAFALEVVLGLTSFWLLEIGGMLRAVAAVVYFLSGHLFPLDLLPAPLGAVVEALPFQYLAYFPATVFLEKITGTDLLVGLLIQAAWCTAALFAADRLCRRGLRRHAAFGG